MYVSPDTYRIERDIPRNELSLVVLRASTQRGTLDTEALIQYRPEAELGYFITWRAVEMRPVRLQANVDESMISPLRVASNVIRPSKASESMLLCQ